MNHRWTNRGYSDQKGKRAAKIVKKGKKLRELDAEKRHKLRIAAKKLRYGGEFFATLLPGKKSANVARSF